MMTVSIIYTEGPHPEQQWFKSIQMPFQSTVLEAIVKSGITQVFLNLSTLLEQRTLKAGIFGQLVLLEHVLKPEDRIEIYRPLQCDPKLARRKRIS